MRFSPNEVKKRFGTAKALFALARLSYDVDQLDRVFNIRDAGSDTEYLDEISQKLAKVMPNFETFHRDRVRLQADPKTLAKLPEGTLGRTYADFLTRYNIHPEAFPDYDIKTKHDYMRAHLYETHDLWHVLIGFDPTPAGEAGVQAFYAAQTWGVLPAALLSALLLNAAIKRDEMAMKDRLSAMAAGWRIGTQAKLLIGYPWNERLAWQLSECRKEMNIDVQTEGPGIAPNVRAAA